mgnify:CR=1 FL=1
MRFLWFGKNRDDPKEMEKNQNNQKPKNQLTFLFILLTNKIK